METHFADAARLPARELESDVQAVSSNPVMSGLLQSVGGLLAILNEQRQIVALNEGFLKLLGIDDLGETLGLRPGEALHCVHAEEGPAGCGTTPFCSTCGAAVAIVASLGSDQPVERTCALQSFRDGSVVDTALLVRSQPVSIEGRRFLLLFVQDVTLAQRRAALDRTFFHDVKNMLSGLQQASELLTETSPSRLSDIVLRSTRRLVREVEIQEALSKGESADYGAMWRDCPVAQLVDGLRDFLANHPAAKGKHIEFCQPLPEVAVSTDAGAFSRVLSNMLINALEATEDEGVVKMWVEPHDDHVAFCVWNRAAIPPEVARRVFQRSFTTKDGAGRGFGTYSMKLLGEDILGGKVQFSSSAEDGTTFRLLHPIRHAGAPL